MTALSFRSRDRARHLSIASHLASLGVVCSAGRKYLVLPSRDKAKIRERRTSSKRRSALARVHTELLMLILRYPSRHTLYEIGISLSCDGAFPRRVAVCGVKPSPRACCGLENADALPPSRYVIGICRQFRQDMDSNYRRLPRASVDTCSVH